MPIRHRALAVETADWSLALKTVADPSAQLARLAAAIGRQVDDPALVGGLEVMAPGWKGAHGLSSPRVFENTTYGVSIRPNGGSRVLAVRHPVRADIEELFDEDENGTWHASLRTANDLGWFPLEILVGGEPGSKPRIDRVSWQVWPLKLDFARDFREITGAVERDYPLWLFRFMAPTRHDAGRSARRGERFLLVWAAQFQSLWEELERGLNIVVERPHVRLAASPARLRADAIKGKLGRKVEESVAARRDRPDYRFQTETWRSSADTPENRFVLHVLESCVEGLERFQSLVEQPGLSESFRALLKRWLRSLHAFRGDPLFRGLKPFTGFARESLVLQNRAGYAAVYRSWLELRRHLDFFAGLSSTRIGMRSIDEIYEIWCFLEIRNILEDLGFSPVERRRPRWRDRGLERELVNGTGAAFEFVGQGGLSLRLSHEPVYSRLGVADYKSFTVSQRPDIVLEAEWPLSIKSPARRLLWIFDAKYRLKSPDPEWDRDEGQGRKADFLAPPDALDQMHRYRDSILLALEGGKSRPVVSAFALYPAPYDQRQPPETNPYADAIKEVGIGAFPLLPGKDGRNWLTSHLRSAINAESAADVTRRPAVKIPVTGLVYEEEDLLVVFLSSSRSRAYLDAFRDGHASGFHMYVEGGPDISRLAGVRYLAAVSEKAGPAAPRRINGAYLVKDILRRRRLSLGEAETGTAKARLPEADCHWLELGSYLQLARPIELGGEGGHWFRYTSLRRLFAAESFADL